MEADKQDCQKDKILNIQELIVVEGQNDANKIREALGQVDVIWTHGFGLTEEKMKLITQMALRKGVIICTDPDFPGKQIRDKISSRIPGAKHVYFSRRSALNQQENDIGVENVSLKEIRAAFAKILEENSKQVCPSEDGISMQDLLANGLAGKEGSAARRSAIGKILGIGDANAKQFLYRVKRFGISRESFRQALRLLEREDV